MGIRINKSKIKLAILGLSLIGLSVGGLSYITSKGVENKIYNMSFQTLPQGSVAEGLAFKFNKEDISCSGLVKFDCTINNFSLYNPNTKLNVFKAKTMDIGTFSKKGIRLGNLINLYVNIKGIEPHKDFKEWNNLNNLEKKIKEDIFPFDITGKFNIEYYSNNESKGTANLEIFSKVVNFNIETNLLRLLNNNIKKLRKEDINKIVPNTDIYTIINNFNIEITNKKFNNVLYNIYLTQYMNVNTEEEQRLINKKFIGINNSKKLTLKELEKELSKKINSFSRDNDVKNFVDNINTLFSKENIKLTINGKNKNFYTLTEIVNSVSNQSKFGQLKYFDIIIKTGDIK